MENQDQVKINVLYVDDEVGNLNAFKASFRRDFNVFTAESADEGYEIIKQNEIEIILTDQRMPGKTGVEFLQSVIKTHPETMRILVTGYSDITAVIDAVNKGKIYRYISKPWNNEALRMSLNQAYEVYSLRKENRALTESLLQANNQLEFMLRQKLIS
jgi:response regulator RpfG family c-di-GMP phosphodiesterase